MKIAVIGVGYVGLVTAACFSEMGNEVVCVDVDEHKIQKLNAGKIPIYEPGLQEIVVNNSQKNLFFTTEVKSAITASEIIFIAVGTPMGDDGNADVSFVYQVAKDIGRNISSYKMGVS